MMYDRHMRRDRWSPEDDAELRRLVATGARRPAVARDLDRSQGSITSRMALLGIYFRKGRDGPSKTAADHLEMVERRVAKAEQRAQIASEKHALGPDDEPVKRGRGRPRGSVRK